MVPNLPVVPASQGQGGGWGLVQASAPLGLPPRPLRKKRVWASATDGRPDRQRLLK